MINHYNGIKYLFFVIDQSQEFCILLTQHDTCFGVNPKSDLLLQIPGNKFLHCGKQFTVVIIIAVHPMAFLIQFNKSKGAN